jgi:hypothetical protein
MFYEIGSEIGLYHPPGGALRSKGWQDAHRGEEELDLGPSDRVVLLFTKEVTLYETLGNCYHFIKPIHRIKNLLSVK